MTQCILRIPVGVIWRAVTAIFPSVPLLDFHIGEWDSPTACGSAPHPSHMGGLFSCCSQAGSLGDRALFGIFSFAGATWGEHLPIPRGLMVILLGAEKKSAARRNREGRKAETGSPE